jgi:hypothetical protein
MRYLGRLLKQSGEAKLKPDAPDRAILITFNDEPGLDLED